MEDREGEKMWCVDKSANDDGGETTAPTRVKWVSWMGEE